MNLATQPWIRVLDKQNRLIELSLYDVLAQAHHIRMIHGSTPLERVALFRLILALLYRTSQPVTEEEAAYILNSGQFDTGPIRSYLTTWHVRFNLFDEEQPFFQYARPPIKLKPRNINRLFLNHSTGIKGTLHSHVHDSTKMNLTPAQAARGVVIAQCFLTTGGNSGRPGQMFRHTGPLRQTNFILQGQSLFESLWFHLFPKSLEQDLSPFFPEAIPSSEDRPVWERDDPESPVRQQPQGPLDALTYPCRIIKLLPDVDGKTINKTLISQSLWIKQNVPLFDPMVAYRLVPGKEEEEAKVYPVKIERGFLAEPLLLEPDVENLAFPVYTRWRYAVQRGILSPKNTLFTAIGVECDQRYASLTHQIYNHHLQLPADVLVDEARLSIFKQVGEEAQSWSRISSQALQTGIQSLPESRRKPFQSLPSQLQKELLRMTECWLPLVIAGKESLDWERTVWKMVNQQATYLPIEAKAIVLNKFNQLRTWKRKGEQDTGEKSNE